MIKKVRVSAVSYFNTSPFIYGLKKSGFIEQCELVLDTPAECAFKLINDKADVGLVPVAVLPQLKFSEIISDYCIGSAGKVKTVCLYSQQPLNKIDRIVLDYQSKTSVLLLKILAFHFWKIDPEWINGEAGYENKISGSTAGLVIGDRTFGLDQKFRYKIDLGEVWHDYTSLPFVFACWASTTKLSEQWKRSFNSALETGVNTIDEMLKSRERTSIDFKTLQYYLKNNINFHFNEEKKKGLELFYRLSRSMTDK